MLKIAKKILLLPFSAWATAFPLVARSVWLLLLTEMSEMSGMAVWQEF